MLKAYDTALKDQVIAHRPICWGLDGTKQEAMNKIKNDS